MDMPQQEAFAPLFAAMDAAVQGARLRENLMRAVAFGELDGFAQWFTAAAWGEPVDPFTRRVAGRVRLALAQYTSGRQTGRWLREELFTAAVSIDEEAGRLREARQQERLAELLACAEGYYEDA